MNTELNILKQISENKGRASVQLIAKELRMRNDYIRYLCLELTKKGLVRRLKRRDWCKITQRGQREIGKLIKKYPSKKRSVPKRMSRKKIKKRIKKKQKKKIRRGFKSTLFTHRKARKKPKHKPEKKTKKRPKRKAKKKAIKRSIKKVKIKVKKKVKKNTTRPKKINKITKVLKNLFRIKEG